MLMKPLGQAVQLPERSCTEKKEETGRKVMTPGLAGDHDFYDAVIWTAFSRT